MPNNLTDLTNGYISEAIISLNKLARLIQVKIVLLMTWSQTVRGFKV